MNIDEKYRTDGTWFDELDLVDDIVWYDGPLICLHKACNGQLYLEHFIDVDDTGTWWAVYPVGENYDTEDLHALIRKEPTILLIHDVIDNQLFETKFYEVPQSELDDDYLPLPPITIRDVLGAVEDEENAVGELSPNVASDATTEEMLEFVEKVPVGTTLH